MKSFVAQSQPQYSFNETYNEPRRTTRLEPPAREETPDPFEQSPEDPFLPASSSDVHQDLQKTSDLTGYSVQFEDEHGSASHPPAHDEEDEDSQLFPGSDLF